MLFLVRLGLMVIVFVAIIGICLGSFVNALVWRLHEQGRLRTRKKPSTKRLAELSVTKGRSMCPDCRHMLAARDLVPIVSWLLLRGKCRYCRAPISWQYPLVELLGGALFVVSYVFWPYELTLLGATLLVLWLVSLVYILALGVYDARWLRLPTVLVIQLGVLSLLFSAGVLLYEDAALKDVLVVVLSVVLLWGLFRGIYALSDKLIGYGDVRLAIPLALFAATPLKVCILLFVASSIGTLAAAPLLLTDRKKLSAQLPFGPYLLLGVVVIVLFGNSIADWLQNTVFYV